MSVAPENTQPLPLAGIRVIDYSHFLAGPYVGRCLAGLGAEVIKVERPGSGDAGRHHAWFVGEDDAYSGYFLQLNMGKQGLSVNTKDPRGKALMHKLVDSADVFIENYRPGALDKLGLGYAELSQRNPGLVYCSISAYGHTGPDAHRAGFGLIAEAKSGIMQMVGTPGEPPPLLRISLGDMYTGIHAVAAINAALLGRTRTGRGQHIDMALMDVAMAVLANQGAGYLNSGQVPGRLGNSHPSVVPYQDFPTADGRMLLAIGNDGQFARFCAAAGTAWAQEPRFATNAARVVHRAALIPMMDAVTRQRPTAEWIVLLEDKAVPCGAINDIGQAFDDAQVQARGLAVTQRRYADGERPAGEKVDRVVTAASPLRLSETPPTLRHAPPALGQHTDAVLAERLGLGADDIAGLRARGVL